MCTFVSSPLIRKAAGDLVSAGGRETKILSIEYGCPGVEMFSSHRDSHDLYQDWLWNSPVACQMSSRYKGVGKGQIKP